MIRFILLSFAVMGWTFYEMSGGSDFDASTLREARLAALEAEKPVVAEAKIEAPKTTAVVAAAPAVSVDKTLPTATAEVTRVSLNLTTLQTTQTPAAPQANVESTDVPVPQNVSIVTSSADTPAIIPSLIDPTDGVVVQASAAASPSFDDIRTVSGNRVNVRGGPGTDFGIVGRLVRGDEVQVIEDNGAGWVRFETSDGGTSGWMADFLLVGG
ncbi:MAG: SH3 domain-containing protein [Sulfitobacter sp.]